MQVSWSCGLPPHRTIVFPPHQQRLVSLLLPCAALYFYASSTLYT